MSCLFDYNFVAENMAQTCPSLKEGCNEKQNVLKKEIRFKAVNNDFL